MRALTLKGSKEIKVHMHIHSSWVQCPNIILYLIIIRHLMAKITFSLTWSKGMACVQTPLPSDFSWGEEGSVHRIAKKGTKHAEHDGMGTLWWYCDAQIQHQPFFSIYPPSEYAQTVHEITDQGRTALLKKLAFDIIVVQFMEYMWTIKLALIACVDLFI